VAVRDLRVFLLRGKYANPFFANDFCFEAYSHSRKISDGATSIVTPRATTRHKTLFSMGMASRLLVFSLAYTLQKISCGFPIEIHIFSPQENGELRRIFR
jgi:hypothetical protein